jgi:cytochrome c oxidase subunit I
MTVQEKISEPDYLQYTGKHKGIFAWILSTDHKRIGLLYLYSFLVMFTVAAILGLLMKLELIAPGKTVMDPQTYNAFFSLHGIVMIFAIVIPGIPAVFGNFFLPILIGAKDVAFPRLNLFSWYLYISGVTLVLVSQFAGEGAPTPGGPSMLHTVSGRRAICFRQYSEPLYLAFRPS